MAKTVKTTTEEVIADGTEVVIDENESPSEAEQLRELLELGTDSVRWNVKRISPADKAGHCTTYSTSELTPDRIREDWGSGRYNIRGIDAQGRYVGSKTISIVEGVRKSDGGASIQNSQDIAAIIAAVKPSGDNTTLLAIMQMMQASQKTNTDMILAMINRPLPVQPAPPDPLLMIAALKDILKPDKSDSIDTLLKGLELGKELGGGGSDWTDLIGKGISVLGSLPPPAENTPAPVTPPAGQRRLPAPPPGTVPAAAAAPGNPQEDDPMLRVMNWMNAQLKALLVQASRQKDPELYAEVMLDNLPPYITTDFLYEQFADEKALDKLIGFNADVAKFRPWFEAFREAVLNFLAPDESPENDDVPPDTEVTGGETNADGETPLTE